jgi:hypothetical protein
MRGPGSLCPHVPPRSGELHRNDADLAHDLHPMHDEESAPEPAVPPKTNPPPAVSIPISEEAADPAASTHVQTGDGEQLPASKRTIRLSEIRGRILVGLASPTAIALVILALAFGFIGGQLRPDSVQPSPPVTSLFQLYVPKAHQISDVVVSKVAVVRGAPVGPPGSISVIYSLATQPLGSAADWYLVADLPAGDYKSSVSGMTAGPDETCANRRCVPPSPGLSRHIYMPTPQSAQQGGVNLIYTWINESPLISSSGSKVSFVVPGSIVLSPESAAQGPFSWEPLDHGFQVMSYFGHIGDFAIDAGPPPTGQFAGYLIWHTEDPLGSSGIRVDSAHSVSGQEAEHSAEFLSGIFLGLAGAAAIASIQEFLNRARPILAGQQSTEARRSPHRHRDEPSDQDEGAGRV